MVIHYFEIVYRVLRGQCVRRLQSYKKDNADRTWQATSQPNKRHWRLRVGGTDMTNLAPEARHRQLRKARISRRVPVRMVFWKNGEKVVKRLTREGGFFCVWATRWVKHREREGEKVIDRRMMKTAYDSDLLIKTHQPSWGWMKRQEVSHASTCCCCWKPGVAFSYKGCSEGGGGVG